MPKPKRILSQLRKPVHYTSINFKSQTPGSIGELVNPTIRHLNAILDPEHPGAHALKDLFPRFRTELLGIRAIPKALLAPPQHLDGAPFRYQNLLNEALAEENETSKSRKIPMSVQFSVSKKNTHKSATVRNKLVAKIKTALTLLLIRGATVEEDISGRRSLALNETRAELGKDWILHGWTYLFFVPLTIYRAPYADIVSTLRDGLDSIKTRGKMMEEGWEAVRVQKALEEERKEAEAREAPQQEIRPVEELQEAMTVLTEYSKEKEAASRSKARPNNNLEELLALLGEIPEIEPRLSDVLETQASRVTTDKWDLFSSVLTREGPQKSTKDSSQPSSSVDNLNRRWQTMDRVWKPASLRPSR